MKIAWHLLNAANYFCLCGYSGYQAARHLGNAEIVLWLAAFVVFMNTAMDCIEQAITKAEEL